MWSVLGNFNSVMGAHKNIGHLPPHISYCEFQQAMQVVDLLQIDATWSFFTWVRRGLHSYVECKLDQVFCNQVCLDIWKSFTCFTLTRHQSHLMTLFFKFVSDSTLELRPIIFQSVWTDHKDFLLVLDTWSFRFSSPMFRVMTKLSLVKTKLKQWNRVTFGNINDSIT